MTTADLCQPVRFDRDLIRRYDRPGPRYTSYPAAPHFSDAFGATDYADLLRRSRLSPAPPLPLSLYLHIPFCETRCFFCGCNVAIARDRGRARRYLPLLVREMQMAAEPLGAADRRAVQVHWGGGTPTFLPPEEIASLMAALHRLYPLAEDAEVSVEVDPRRCTPAHLDALAAAGVNRISVGVQDLDPEVQQAVNRVQPAEVTREVLAGARARGIAGTNVDLIYGLPHQTPERFAATVEEVVAMAPDRVSVFNFAYLPAMFPHQKAIDAGALPDAATKLTILEETIAALTAAGYLFIGMDHFARPGDPLARALSDRTLGRNFQGYTTHAEVDLVGFGASSIGLVAGGYAQNRRTVEDYRRAIEAGSFATCRGLVLSAEDRLRRDVILRLMSHFRLDKAEIAARHGIDFDHHFATELSALAPLADDGLVELGPDRIEVTPVGRLLVRNVAMAFDAYLSAERAGRYSRTV
jgi:oxygen-independent coproporphyrinogen III oxidase